MYMKKFFKNLFIIFTRNKFSLIPKPIPLDPSKENLADKIKFLNSFNHVICMTKFDDLYFPNWTFPIFSKYFTIMKLCFVPPPKFIKTEQTPECKWKFYFEMKEGAIRNYPIGDKLDSFEALLKDMALELEKEGIKWRD